MAGLGGASPRALHDARLAQEQPLEAPAAAQAALSTETPASAEATEDDLQVEDTVSPAEKEQGEEAAAAHDPAKYAAFIRFAVSKVREKVLPKLEDKMEVKHGEKMERLTWTLCGASLAGLLLLFMPIFLARKYPGKMGVLFRFSAVAAGSAVSVLLLFAAVVLLIKNVQGIAGSATNPQLMIVDASLDRSTPRPRTWSSSGRRSSSRRSSGWARTAATSRR